MGLNMGWNMLKLKATELSPVRYALEDVIEWLSDSSISGCDCGCGGDSMDYDGMEMAYKEGLETLKVFGIEVIE